MISNAHRPALLEDPKLDRYRALLAQSAIFRGCSGPALDDLARRLQIRTRSAGTLIVAQDEPGDAMFILAQGRVKVALFGENGRELTLSELKPGDFFGEMSLIDSRPRSANVVAIDDATMLALTREAFVQHLKSHPQTALNILSELTRRLRRADETIANLALHDVESRLSRTLERLAREDGESTEAGLVLKKRPTQQDLANMVGSCRETISRTFTSMIKRGLLVPRGRALVLTRQLLDRMSVAAPQPA
jgi:CRP/FNR family transcriptional regulator, cyclic AMP receptor protein